MNTLSKKKASSKTAKLSFAKTIVDMSTRGDMDSIVDLLKGYWRDRKSHPWHTLYASIGADTEAFENDQDLENALIRLRDGLFGALELGSLSLPLHVSGSELLSIVLSGKSWVDGRRKARASCTEMIVKSIEKGELDHLTAIGLEIDGMGYMVPPLKQEQVAQYRNAKPEEKDGKYDLKKLARSSHGHKVMRAAGVTQTQLDKADPRAAQLVESYEHLLVELELDLSTPSEFPQETLQTTLNGDLVEEPPDKKVAGARPKETEPQQPLTEFISEPKKPVKKRIKPAEKSAKKPAVSKMTKKTNKKLALSRTKTKPKAKGKEASSKR